jgi:uncharacterized protein (TIGR03435 family)
MMLFVAPAGAQQASPDVAAAGPPSFEVASIKLSNPDKTGQDFDVSNERVSLRNYTLRQLIHEAYGLKADRQIEGGEKWMDAQRYDIAAKIDDAEYARLRTLNGTEYSQEFNRMLQELLVERFQLQVTRKERIMPVYALAVSKSGAKLSPSPPQHGGYSMSINSGQPDVALSTGNMTPRNDTVQMIAAGVSMDSLADALTRQRETGDRIVVNRTGLRGDYDFKMIWTTDRGEGAAADSPYPGLFTALQDQLGLKLESQKGSVEVIAIQSATEPVID